MNNNISDDERIDKINDELLLIQKKGGLTFGTDAYMLAAFAKAKKKGECADFGAGTGVISLLMAQRGKYRRIYSLEVQESFASLIARNTALNGLENVIVPVHCDLRRSTEYIEQGSLDCIVSNPPYMPVGSGAAPDCNEMNIARREENGTIYDFCKSACLLLKHGGLFYTVYRPDRGCELIHAMKENSLEPKRIIYVYPDITKPPSLMLTEAKKGAAPSVKISRPLVIYRDTSKEKRCYTEDMDRLYSEFTLDFMFTEGK